MNELCLTSRTRLCSVAFLFLGLCAFAHIALAQNQEITLSLGGNASQSRSFQLGHPLRFCIQHVKAADDVGIRISQQRKFDVMTLGEISEDCWAVITDRSQFDALVVESCPSGLQLHELRFAKRSPVS